MISRFGHREGTFLKSWEFSGSRGVEDVEVFELLDEGFVVFATFAFYDDCEFTGDNCGGRKICTCGMGG